ncbi:MAG: G2/mitotic-specific cyclin [Thelocarpon superellum]|nr:MAG: G2/mitotic-specific cyclin [Thelocarpon superellum]
MPPARPGRVRMATNENDENSASTRLTRAKAAALATDDVTGGAMKKALQSKKSSTNAVQAHAAPLQRKRAALGDVSNVTKGEVESKDAKKALGGAKLGLVSKATQNAGVHKPSRTSSNRSILGSKDNNKRGTTADLKRPASGSGVMGGVPKKRHTSSSGSQPSIKEDDATAAAAGVDETEAARKFASVPKKVGTVEASVDVEDEVGLEDEEVKNLDLEDVDDPLMVAEYVVDIFEYLKVLEEATMPNPDYMDHQEDLEWKMRGILVDWLIEVHTRFHLLPETLFLAVNIIDRFLSSKVVPLERLQLVGVTAMFIASKYEEVLSPHVANFRHVADDGFTEDEILSAERYVLAALNYDLSYPNPMNFLRRISKADNYDIQTRTLGKYLMEISLLDYRFMKFQPSHVAASSMYLARMILDRGEWDATLSHYAGYTPMEIEPVFQLMIDYLAKPVAHEAFFKKYASKKFLKASILTRQWAKKHVSQNLNTAKVPQ